MKDVIIVDIEGVIRDSKNTFHHAYEYALASVGLKLNSYPNETWKLRGYSEFNPQKNFLKALYAIAKSGEDITRIFWKKRPTEYMNELIKIHSPSAELLETMEEFYLKYITSPHVIRRISPHRAGKKGLKYLKEDGYKLSALTNSGKEYNEAWLKCKGVFDYFDLVLSAEEIGVPKPAPDGILKACDKLKVKPKDVVYVGDSEVDILAAVKAGCIPIGVMSGMTERHKLKALGATYVFKNLTEFALWLRHGGKVNE